MNTPHGKYTLTEMRRIAAGAARSIVRKTNDDVSTVTADDALAVLDDLTRTDPDLVASVWYMSATEAQIKIFRAEWGKRNV